MHAGGRGAATDPGRAHWHNVRTCTAGLPGHARAPAFCATPAHRVGRLFAATQACVKPRGRLQLRTPHALMLQMHYHLVLVVLLGTHMWRINTV